MFFFFKQKTAYEMRISDWSSDVCSSDLSAMSEGDSDFRVRPVRIRSTRAPRAKSFINQVLRAAKRAGHTDGASSSGTKSGRSSAFGRSRDRKSVVSGKRVSVSVYLGGRRIIKTNKILKKNKFRIN